MPGITPNTVLRAGLIGAAVATTAVSKVTNAIFENSTAANTTEGPATNRLMQLAIPTEGSDNTPPAPTVDPTGDNGGYFFDNPGHIAAVAIAAIFVGGFVAGAVCCCIRGWKCDNSSDAARGDITAMDRRPQQYVVTVDNGDATFIGESDAVGSRRTAANVGENPLAEGATAEAFQLDSTTTETTTQTRTTRSSNYHHTVSMEDGIESYGNDGIVVLTSDNVSQSYDNPAFEDDEGNRLEQGFGVRNLKDINSSNA